MIMKFFINIADSPREYNGNWENGLFHGKGTMIWGNNDVYKGYWKNDIRHGVGITYIIYGNTTKKNQPWNEVKLM